LDHMDVYIFWQSEIIALFEWSKIVNYQRIEFWIILSKCVE